ncbi:hypothetical protein [Polaribacter tangerinus]|uniref:hypothetical protein n=1 Tax=Polaribacter tangerinus TaxID=1920034 RepID=UPI000B4AE0FE|nr:hypothetical protein [Polaribacter tangerinus]
MIKRIKILTVLTISLVTLSAFTYKDNSTIEKAILLNCGEGYTEVNWSVTCPNGITYTGERCFRSEHAPQIAVAIMNAPCPQ